jgi:hypothetical protein
MLGQDPKLAAFLLDLKAEKAPMSGWNRLIISGVHGKWYHLGHRSVSATFPETMYMDEHSVRIRAGLLNSITWLAMMNIFFFKDQIFVHILFPLVAFEFLSSGIFGLTPLAPLEERSQHSCPSYFNHSPSGNLLTQSALLERSDWHSRQRPSYASPSGMHLARVVPLCGRVRCVYLQHLHIARVVCRFLFRMFRVQHVLGSILWNGRVLGLQDLRRRALLFVMER